MASDPSADAEAKKRRNLAWAAGFFDGEGWANATGSRRRRAKQPQAKINQASADVVPEVLVRFRDAVGVGRIGGPELKENRQPLYRWVASSRGYIARTFDLLRPWLGVVKRAEFARALGTSAGGDPIATVVSSDERAWAAGLFDGEGWTGLEKHRSHAGYFVLEMALTQSSSASAVPQVLERFIRVVRCGRVYGPYGGGAGNRVFRWRTFGLDNVQVAMHALLPWLGQVKRRQACAACATFIAQPSLPRGNPAWGAYKTRCVNGHEYASARVRPYRPRSEGGRPWRPSKQCLVCTREQARMRRAAQPNADYFFSKYARLSSV
ncbi:MAG: hypothetical protein AUH85_12000 [Chloroflexi bacterium 13_1_40CM_4_68_4]|nr:MAG: hypothetical protein AUH85_12000 [Chloroflexi bacterium 13_1_40CM_4_68_4]